MTPKYLRRLSTVPRWSVVPMLRQQSVAEHSFHVAWIALWIAERSALAMTGKLDMATLLRSALEHDELEGRYGDAPSTNKDPKYEGDQYYVILKMADCLEALMFINEDSNMGNRTLEAIHKQCYYRYIRWGALFEGGGAWTPADIYNDLMRQCAPWTHPSLEGNNEN